MRRTRAALLVVLLPALGVPLGLHVGQRLRAALGEPSLSEIEDHRVTDARALRFDLGVARRGRDGTLRLSLPGEWTGEGAPGAAPRLLVFVDGAPVRFDRRPQSADPSEPAAYYVPVGPRDLQLGLRCGPGPPCRSAVVVADGRWFRLKLGAMRLRAHPVWLFLALAGVCLWSVVAIYAVERASTRALVLAAVAGSLPLAAWLFRSAASAPGSDALLLLATVGFCGPALQALLADARAGWGREILDVLDTWSTAIGRWLASPRRQPWLHAVVVATAMTLYLPLAVRGRTFYSDWANHLYYVERQAEAVRELQRPSYFLHSTLPGAFYPYFAFYGGTLYVVTALLGIAIGSVFAAYVAVFALGFALAGGGTTWLGRQAGLGPQLAPVAGLVVVSSAYYLTNAYGRGSWAELVATSAIALLVAAAASLVWSPEVRRRDAALLFLAAVIFSGSHTITLVWGSAFLALLLLVTWPARAAAGLSMPRRRSWLAAALIALAVGVNAWFLAPALAYGRATHIGGYAARGFASDTQFLNVPRVLFHPGRTVPAQSGTPGLYTQVSVYVLAWAAAAALMLYRRTPSAALRRGGPGLAMLLVLFFWLIDAGRLDPPWTLMPRVLKIVQFQFRLHTYVTYSLAGLVIVSLLASRAARRPALWVATLVAALVAQVGLGEYQAWTAATYYPVTEITSAGAESPPTLDRSQVHDYRFVEHPDVRPLGEAVFPSPASSLRVDLHGIQADRLSVVLEGDGLVRTNVVYSPLIEATGDVILAGRTADGAAVLRARTPGSGLHEGAIVSARPPPVVIGVAISIGSFAAALLLIGRVRRLVPPEEGARHHVRAGGDGGGASRAGGPPAASAARAST